MLKKIFSGLLICLALLMLFYSSEISMHGFEHSSIYRNGAGMVAAKLILGAALYGLIRLICRCRISPETLFKICFTLRLLSGLFIILNVKAAIYYDQKKIFDSVFSFAANDFSLLERGEYLYNYPHQLGLLLFESIAARFSRNPLFFWLLNLAFILGTDYLSWQIVKLLCPENPNAEKCAILLCAGFLPSLFYCTFVYGDVPALFFLLLCFYGVLNYLRGNERRWLPVILISAVCAYLLRNNSLIPLCAIGAVMVIARFRERKFAALCLPALLLIAVLGSGGLVKAYYAHLSGLEITEGIPKPLYFAMGLCDADGVHDPGWYNGYNWTTFVENDCQPDVANRAARHFISERLTQFGADPAAAFAFFKSKIISTWCDPTFQSLWYSPLHIRSGPIENPLLQSLRGEGNGLAYKAVRLFCASVNLLTFVSAAWSVSRGKRRGGVYEWFVVLSFLGIFGFHLFWETKSRYVLPAAYFLRLLPCAFLEKTGK